MGIWQIIVGSVVLIMSVLMIIVIILQEGHDSGLGTITGGADSFTKRGKAKTADAVFAKVTKFCAILFFVFVVVLNALSYFGLTGKPKAEKQDEVIQSSSVVSDVSTEGSAEASADTSNEESAEASKQESTEVSTEASKQESAEASKEASTQTSTEASKEASAQTSTETSQAATSTAA
ncbi:MAG: preprotein translocase subunit SecG [Clostridia bacterium]|nr:preprotein translocase subunit SecG [Clostridia bacterium]